VLILSRRPGQTILIQDNISVTILEVSGDRVKLGINAPKEVRVLRRELEEAVRAENLTAAAASSKDFSDVLPSLDSIAKPAATRKR
jgi:carbon storage regulator